MRLLAPDDQVRAETRQRFIKMYEGPTSALFRWRMAGTAAGKQGDSHHKLDPARPAKSTGAGT
ncbi:hypothetical protein JOJ86_004836 [Rhodococcus percolatus]|nr:hypothetical protein [Rhodococcus opacus]MBP2207110.1 hypothetical protein [Rhodococcus opacus]CAG7620688.1 hypothetical protein E143388_06258 [Rhodococcus opacus]